MHIQYKTIYLKKRFALAISRGVTNGTDNLFLAITMQDITGFGEMSPGRTEGADSVEAAQSALESFTAANDLEALSVDAIHDLALEQQVPACAIAALDMALWDWLARKNAQPLYQMLGFPRPKVPTSVTVGINPPEVLKERVPLLLEGTGVRSLKLKLGSPEGIEVDQAMYAQVAESARAYGVSLRVDANGGWDVAAAKTMMRWIADRGADYVEQPLEQGAEDGLPELFRDRPLPILIDESCHFVDDANRWAHCVDGVNIKMMKCGGVTGALRIIAAAKEHGLKIMVGCMGESSMSIAAAAALTGLADHVDLDSHLNLDPDPSLGTRLQEGVVVPLANPGHGATLKPEYAW